MKQLKVCGGFFGQMLLKAAARLFPTQGFDAATTLQLAIEAGVPEPLIYYYFSGKA